MLGRGTRLGEREDLGFQAFHKVAILFSECPRLGELPRVLDPLGFQRRLKLGVQPRPLGRERLVVGRFKRLMGPLKLVDARLVLCTPRFRGFGLFLWGVAATTIPLILAMFLGKYVFRFHDAIVLGCCSGARTTTASLGMINDRAKSQIPGLGYTVTYAVGNTLLTVWGMVLVILLS